MGLAVGLNLALVASFGYSELVPPGLRSALWLALGVAWLVLAVMSLGWDASDLRAAVPASSEDAFPSALDYYLKGNWFQAERVLREQIRETERDLEARLLLATLLRHTQRPKEAARELEALMRFEGWQKWAWEIARERELLANVAERPSAERPTAESQPAEVEAA